MQFVRVAAAVLVASAGVSQGVAPVLPHSVTPLPDQTRVLQEQIVALKGSKESLEEEKQALLRSVEKLQKTRSSAETKCVRERIVLREKLRQTVERADNTGTIAEQLQSQNMEMRGEEADAKRKLNKLQHAMHDALSGEELLKESVRQVLRRDWPEWAPPANQSIPKMLGFVVSSLRVENTELHALMSKLEANLSATKRQLTAKVDAAKPVPAAVAASAAGSNHTVGFTAGSSAEDGADEMVQTLQEQNMDLQRQGAAKQLEEKGMQNQIAGLQDDKARLLGTLQSAMGEAVTLRQELAQMRKDKDEEIQMIKRELARHVKALAVSKTPSPQAALTDNAAIPQPAFDEPAATPPAQPSAKQLVAELSSPPALARQPATAADTILEMGERAAVKHHAVEEMKRVAAAASAEVFEPLGSPLSAWEVAPGLPSGAATATEPSRLVSWLGAGSSSTLASWSPVDDLDPEATAQAQKAQTFEEKGDAEEGDSVAQLLSRAQSMVSGATSAA